MITNMCNICVCAFVTYNKTTYLLSTIYPTN